MDYCNNKFFRIINLFDPEHEIPLTQVEFDYILRKILEVGIADTEFFLLVRTQTSNLPIAALIYLAQMIRPEIVGNIIRYHLNIVLLDREQVRRDISDMLSKKLLIFELGFHNIIYNYQY